MKAAGLATRIRAALETAMLILVLVPFGFLYFLGIPLGGSWLILETYPSIDGRLFTALFFFLLFGWIYVMFWHIEPILDKRYQRSLEVVELEKEAGSHDKQKQATQP